MLDFKLSFNEHCDNVLGNKTGISRKPRIRIRIGIFSN